MPAGLKFANYKCPSQVNALQIVTSVFLCWKKNKKKNGIKHSRGLTFILPYDLFWIYEDYKKRNEHLRRKEQES